MPTLFDPILIDGFPRGNRPYNNVQPFTYRDGLSYLEVLESLRAYIRDVLVPHLNKEGADIVAELDKEIAALVAVVNSSLVEQAELVTSELEEQNAAVAVKILELTTYVDTEVAKIIGESVSTSDPLMAQIFDNASSASRVKLDALYGVKAVVDGLVTLTNTGRLSAESLDSAYGSRADVDSLMVLTTGAGRLSSASLAAAFAAKSVEDLVTTGRLTQANLDTRYADAGLTGTYAQRPTANSVRPGTLYYATNVPEVYRSTGSGWSLVAAGGQELGYAFTTPGQSNSTTADVAVAGLSFDIVAGERPVRLIFDGNASAAGSAGAVVSIKINGNNVGSRTITATTATPLHFVIRRADFTPGTPYTIRVDVRSTVASSAANVATGSTLTAITC